MKKKSILALCVAALLVISLCGCSDLRAVMVEHMNGWSFQYNSGTEDYSLFFGLSDSGNHAISAPATVEIRIENEAGELVYSGTKNISENDFGTYTSQARGEEFLAEVRIDASEITPGRSSNGTVYFTVYHEPEFYFDEVRCEAMFCLPVLDMNLTVDGLPITVDHYDYFSSSSIRIDKVEYAVEDNTVMPAMKIQFYGEKVSGSGQSVYDKFNYKIYDSEEYMVDSGMVMLDHLNTGDKFKEECFVYNLTPGETYTLVITGPDY